MNPEDWSVWMLVILFSQSAIFSVWDYVKKEEIIRHITTIAWVS